MENNQTIIEQAEAVANIVQAVVNKVAEKYGGNTAFPRSQAIAWECIQ